MSGVDPLPHLPPPAAVPAAWDDALPAPRPVLGHPVHAVDLAAAAALIAHACVADTPRLIVTLNPELVVRARLDPQLAGAIDRADLVVADGVGVVWAARRGGVHLPGRVPGVELAFAVMALGGPSLQVFLLGGRPGVAEAAAAEARARWGVDVVGSHHGYFDAATEGAAIAALVHESGAQLLLAGLGEGQELFLDAHREGFGARALIGVGGTLDILAGVATRTPAWTRRWGLEWAWRVGLDPRRWHRFPRLLRFVALALRRR